MPVPGIQWGTPEEVSGLGTLRFPLLVSAASLISPLACQQHPLLFMALRHCLKELMNGCTAQRNFSSYLLKLGTWEVHNVSGCTWQICWSLKACGGPMLGSALVLLYPQQPHQLGEGWCCKWGTGAGGLEQRVMFTLSLRAESFRLGHSKCRGWGWQEAAAAAQDVNLADEGQASSSKCARQEGGCVCCSLCRGSL